MTDRDLMQQALDALRQCEFTTPPAQRQIVRNAIVALNERLAHCDRCGKKLGGEGDIHTCTPKTNQCGETCERAKMCATCAGVLTEFDEAVAAVDATLHHAVDHWQERALKAEALLAQPEQEPVSKYCCHACFDKSGQVFLERMILCPECGNKRCPKATNHELQCTNSNEPNQAGSAFTTYGYSPEAAVAVYTHQPQRDELRDELRERLAQPEQEPVAHPFEDKSVISALSWAAGLIEQAYRASGGHNGADSWLMNYADKQGERIRQADHREWEKVNGRWQVKVTPPQRTWVGLTDEEIDDIYWQHKNHCGDYEVPIWPYERGIEAKLKEKNT